MRKLVYTITLMQLLSWGTYVIESLCYCFKSYCPFSIITMGFSNL